MKMKKTINTLWEIINFSVMVTLLTIGGIVLANLDAPTDKFVIIKFWAIFMIVIGITMYINLKIRFHIWLNNEKQLTKEKQNKFIKGKKYKINNEIYEFVKYSKLHGRYTFKNNEKYYTRNLHIDEDLIEQHFKDKTIREATNFESIEF